MDRLGLTLFLISCFINFSNAEVKVYKLERIGNCMGKNRSRVLDFSGLSPDNDRIGFRVKGKIVVNRDVKGILHMLISIARCPERGAKKCNNELFKNYFYRNYCPELENNFHIGDAFVKGTDPPFKCPLKKGEHFATRHMYNLSKYDLMPFDGFRWSFTMDFYEEDRKKPLQGNGKGSFLGCWMFQITRTNKRQSG